MTARSTVHHTFVVERHYPVPPQRVFAAFADKAKKRRWQVEGEGFAIEAFEMDFRVGGAEYARFRHDGGPPISLHASYQDIVPDERIVFVYTMGIEEVRFSSSLTTIEFRPGAGGTDLVFTEQGVFFDGMDDVLGREQGCRALLEQLAKEVARD